MAKVVAKKGAAALLGRAAARKFGVVKGRFEGFGDLAFFRELAANPSRAWFAAHEDVYQEGFARPMEVLLREVGRKLGPRRYRHCDIVEPRVLPLERARRSAAEPLFEAGCAGDLPVKPRRMDRGEPALGIHLRVGVDRVTGAPDIQVKAGLEAMDSVQHNCFIGALLDPGCGAEFVALIARLAEQGLQMESPRRLKGVPRHVSRNHPRLAEMQRKGLIAVFAAPPVELIHSRALRDWLVARAKSAAPLVQWLSLNAS